MWGALDPTLGNQDKSRRRRCVVCETIHFFSHSIHKQALATDRTLLLLLRHIDPKNSHRLQLTTLDSDTELQYTHTTIHTRTERKYKHHGHYRRRRKRHPFAHRAPDQEHDLPLRRRRNPHARTTSERNLAYSYIHRAPANMALPSL
jgi:hypothetical protein